ncbi:MFS transporter [Telmatospirillum sp.]|uniref:MFS transporter n=1 Tax=Telmatospirillum sp. TaxID=2079197 RepID=UPI00284C1188|nr:MFS transporter [Telmatospirillum sp.]MDR3438314.1 MFS transporter [Telmatospirillum sp.]
MKNLTDIEIRTMRKIKWKIIPFCLALYIINYMDRICIGFGALDMNGELGISNTAFGLLSSVFFIGYFLLEVPSNMCMHKFGARKWMARIIISWGLVTMGMFFAQNYSHVLTLRIFLGIAEAGFFPGMIYYFTYWFPAKDRASIIGLFMLAVPFGNFIAAPVSTLIMDNIHWFNQSGWRWMFMIEGSLAVILGILALFMLIDAPAKAKWLDEDERKWLTAKLAKEDEFKKDTASFTLKQIFSYAKIWQLGLIYFCIQTTTQSVNYWMPTIVKSFSTGWSNSTVGAVLMLPGIISLIVMPFWGMHSDKRRERKWHAAIPMIMSSVGLMMIALFDSIPLRLTGVVLNAVGNVAFYGPFWALPSIYLSGRAAAVGLAIINSLSSAGGFVGNGIIGVIKDTSAGTFGVLSFQAVCCLVAFLVTISLNLKDKALSDSE